VTVLDEADYAKYLEGMTIEEILAESVEDPEIDPAEDESDEVNGSEEEDKDKETVTEEKTDASEKTEKSGKTENSDDSATKNVQDAPKAVGEK